MPESHLPKDARHVIASLSSRRGLLALVLICTSLTLHAERLPIRAYSTADGLPDTEMDRIVTDPRGFLWFCTKGGLARFDGYSFVNFGPDQGVPHGGVTDLVIARDGDYWVATDNGLFQFRPNGQPMFTSIASDQVDRFARTITVLRQGSDGTIWVGTRNGLYRVMKAGGEPVLRAVDIGLFNEPLDHREIAGVTEDRFHTLWIAVPPALYRRWPDGSTERYTTRDGLPGDDLRNVYEDRAGHFWVTTRDAGFAGFEADGSHAAPAVNRWLSLPDGLANVWVDQLLQTSDGRFWVANAVALIEFFPNGDAQGRWFHTFTERHGLTASHVYALEEDLDGNLWIAASNGGAMKLARGGFTTYGQPDGIKNVNAMLEDEAGNLCFRGYVIGDRGKSVFEGARVDFAVDPSVLTRLVCFNGERFESFEPDAIKDWGWVLEGTTLRTRSGEFWLGTAQGAFRYAAAHRFADIKTARPLALYNRSVGLAASMVFRLFEDSAGNVWISTQDDGVNGLGRWDVEDGRVREFAGSPGLSWLTQYRVGSFGEDAVGNVWIGYGDGVARYAHGAFVTFGAAEGLPAGAITDIHRDRSGRLWLGSARAGLVRVDQVESDHPAFVAIQGLSSASTDVIAEDRAGFLYVGRGQGIDRYDPATNRIKHFTADDGLTPGILKAGFTDSAGVLWFGCSNGLVRFEPRPERPPVAPIALISAVRVTGIPQFVSALGERSMSLPALEPDRDQLQIDFVALSFGAGEVLRYQYKLEGAAGDWSAPSRERSVNYASLAPGRYTFLVRALNSDGLVSTQPAMITFTILRPIWLRWWFISAATLVTAAAVFALYRYRVGRVLEVEAIRTRIATDLHDDIGANLTRIALLSEVARQTPGDGPLESIASIARESVGAMSDIVWAINPRRETVADLIRRMRQHADEVFTLREIALQFTAEGAQDSSRLGVDVRRDLLLAFKEAVNNAARHAHCSRASIDLRRDRSSLVLTVADNGVGFDTSRESEGQGLASLRRRAARLHGVLVVHSESGVGTTVTLRVPLSKSLRIQAGDNAAVSD